jgi:hypothetical protein
MWGGYDEGERVEEEVLRCWRPLLPVAECRQSRLAGEAGAVVHFESFHYTEKPTQDPSNHRHSNRDIAVTVKST